LHARVADEHTATARRPSPANRGRDSQRHRRQHLPLHRISEHFQGDSGRSRGRVEEIVVAIKFTGEFTTPRSPDEVYEFLSDPPGRSVAAVEEGDVFVVEAEMEGASARELNRTFLSAVRKVEKRTTLRAEWTSDADTSESFFDYVLKKTIK